MKRIWSISEKINTIVGIKTTSIFLFLNMAVWGIIALLASALIDASNIITSINSFDIYFIITGYSVVIMGFFGGALYIMRVR